MGVYSRHLRPRLHAAALNERVTGEVRARVCGGLTGDVLEIGYGSGLNQPHLPAEVTGIWAVEPSQTALRLSEERRATSPVPVVVAGDDAQSLPFPDDRFDAALCTWVLCGVPDAGAALAEVGVNAPSGSFYAVEASRWMGLGAAGGIRAGIAPYTDAGDVDRLVDAVRSTLDGSTFGGRRG